MARAKQVMECPTCQLVRGILMGAKVPTAAANQIGYSEPVRAADLVAKTYVKKKAKRTVSRYQKLLGKHMKEERRKATKKNGDYKKGRSNKTVMRAAHKCVARELKR